MSLRFAKSFGLQFGDPLWIAEPWMEAEAKLYQGAHVGAYESGIFVADEEKGYFVWHNDVKSMYPSIMMLCNFSPETMKIIELKPYTGEYKISPTLMELPDDRINRQLVIEISEEDGVMRTEMAELMKLRAKYRGEGADSGEKAMKLAANSTYGYNGMRYARYGSYPVAIATTAIGRLIMEKAVALSDGHPDSTTLENDTDGVFTYGANIIHPLEAMLVEMFAEFDPRFTIRVDNTKYFGMICTGKMKNYILRKNHKNIIKGNSLKGRSMPGVCKKALEIIATELFENVDHYDLNITWMGISDIILDQAKLSDFEMSCEVGKSPEEYDEKSMYGRILAYAPWMQHGEELRYVRVTKAEGRYHFMPLGSMSEEEMLKVIDRTYYLKRVKEAIKRLLHPIRESDPVVDQFCKDILDKKKRKRKVKK